MVSKDVREKQLKEKLFCAIKRIRDGNPNDGLLKSLNEKKKLRLNTKNICRDANVSRTLVSGKNCEYPVVRDWLLNEIFNSSTEVLKLRLEVMELRNKCSELEDVLINSDTYNAELIIRAHRAMRGLSSAGGSMKKSTKSERANAMRVVGKE